MVAVLPLTSHPVPRWDGGETRKEGGSFELGVGVRETGLYKTLSPHSPQVVEWQPWEGRKAPSSQGRHLTPGLSWVLEIRIFLGPILGWE